MKTKLALATLTALAGLTTAQAESRFSPIIRAEATYTDTGYKGAFLPKGYEAGAGITAGVLINATHEISVSTSLTDWTSDTNTTPGAFAATYEVKQMPVLLNYRYHFNLDQAGRFSAFVGPTAGLIQEKFTCTITDLGGGFPASQMGSSSDSAWKLAYGGTAGLTANLGKHWTVSASAQLLKVAGANYATNDGFNTWNQDSQTRPSFALSAGYSW
jgi:outer membrane protein W